jgi:selT/selW/selH-like putative selenoprotein
MATELIQKWPGQVESVNLHAGVGGAFEVSVNGKQIWSKLQTKQYPELKVLTEAVTEALG